MNKKPKMFFVAGFLGAGKTTAIRALAELFAKRGLKTAAITNDQAAGLVDTVFLGGEGLITEEVAGSCFCVISMDSSRQSTIAWPRQIPR